MFKVQNMAPVGRALTSGRGLYTIDDSVEKGSDEELKNEPPDRGFLKIKEEPVDNSPVSYSPMKAEEGIVIKKEESDDSMDEDDKSDVDILDILTEKPDNISPDKVGEVSGWSDDPNRALKSLLCKFCGKQFFRAFYFNLHIKTHQIPTPTSDKPHKCLECGKSFALLQHLTGHSRIHIAGRYYECPVCRRKFTELSNLTMHLLKTHPDEKPYKCTDCEKQFTQSSALKKHLRSHSSITSQDELDRIDMLFFVNDKNERESDEPLTKKIKLGKDEKISPFKEKLNVKERLKEEKISPTKEKSVLNKLNSASAEVSFSDSKVSKVPLSPKNSIKSSLRQETENFPKKSPLRDKIQKLEEFPKEKKTSSPQRKAAAAAKLDSKSVDGELIMENAEGQLAVSKDQSSPSKQKSPFQERSEELAEYKMPDDVCVKTEPSPENCFEIAKISYTSDGSPPVNVFATPTKDSSAEEEPMFPAEALLLHIKEECPDESEHTLTQETSISSLNELPEGPSSACTEGWTTEENLMIAQRESVAVFNDSLLITKRAELALVSCLKANETKLSGPELESENQSGKGKVTKRSLSKVMSASDARCLKPQDSYDNTDSSSQTEYSQKVPRPASLSVCNSIGGTSLGSNKFDKKELRPCIEKPEGACEERYKCLRCDIFLDSEEQLHEHLMEHTGVRLCECRFCGKDFTSMTSLKRHLYHHVAGSIPQDCTRCGKFFSTFTDLKDHCASKRCDASDNNFRFKCFRCKKHTPSLERLKFHLLSQCNEDPVKYYIPKKQENIVSINSIVNEVANGGSDKIDGGSAIDNCTDEWVNQKFENSEYLTQEDMKELNLEGTDLEALKVLNELGPSDRGKECWNLQCEKCGQKFENAEKAKVHCRLGCDIKPESNQEFDSKHDKEHELDTKSAKEMEAEVVKMKVVVEEDEDLQCYLNCAVCGKEVAGVERMLLHIKDHINQRNTLECPVLKCGRFFTNPKDFKLHLKTHTAHKPYKCSECGKRFFLRENYENHAQRHGVLKHWSSLSTNEKTGKVSGNTRSPITIESSISNLEVSEADVDKKQSKPSNNSSQTRNRTDMQSKENRKQDIALNLHKKSTFNGPSSKVKKSVPALNKSVPHVNATAPLMSKPRPLVSRPAPTINRPSPVMNKPTPSVNRISPNVSVTSPPPNEKPSPPTIKSSPPTIKTLPPVSRHIPTTSIISTPIPIVTRPIPALLSSSAAVIRPASILQGAQSIVGRISHASGGSLSVTPQGIFTVGAPRSFTISPPSNSKPTFTMVRTRQELTQKEISQTRAHPPSYYRLSDQAKATIQASNAELRKYPRSGRCEICKKTCSRLDKHMMVHLNQKPHLCPICPQAFRQSEHLRRHIRARHEGNHRQFECPQCHKRLTRKDKLKEHMKNCGTRPYPESYSPTLSDSLFDMIPGPSESLLQGHTV
ncbi:Protein glass [Frankliniella fusca]|uniref:Protein glass n=1 Tax=Frankliniella fusca TaxID=407009 RepID=A0AAE1H366_9NEOP|nr:Protein glass [Frankliniella fusca]